jgi:dGTPase
MDWADDVAYSVHDLEDGIVAGHVPLHRLRDDRDQLVDVAREHYSSEPPDALHEALDRILALETWPKGHDGSQRSLVALKRLTSGLIGRFCRAAVTATRERRGDGPLARYAADLHVPAEARAECALLKAITAHYVMFRTAAEETRAEEREVILGLVRELVVRAPDALEPALRAAYGEAADDAQRLRVVIDQVASLTDTSARRWHRRLGGR